MTSVLSPEFSVFVDNDVVHLHGELDLSGVDALKAATQHLVAEGRHVHFDLGGLSFVDSSGLRSFIGLHHAAQSGGFSFTLSRPAPAVFRTFEITALDAVLPWAD